MSRIFRALATLAALVFLSEIAAAHGRDTPHGGNVVTRWNGIAIETLPVDPGLVVDSRAFAIFHAAIHDAVNGVRPRYQPYTVQLSAPGASVDAAVAAAARDVARLCLLLANSTDDVSKLQDERELTAAWREMGLRLQAATDQHAAMTEELESLARSDPRRFTPDQIWVLIRAIKVQSQILQLYVGEALLSA